MPYMLQVYTNKFCPDFSRSPDWTASLLTGFSWQIPVTVYGDASGNSRTTKAARTDYQLIQELFKHNPKYRIAMRQNTANPAVRDRVNTMNNMLKSASGRRNVLIDPSARS